MLIGFLASLLVYRDRHLKQQRLTLFIEVHLKKKSI